MAPDPILIISTEIDVSTDAVVVEMRKRGVPLVRLNTDRYPYETSCSVEFSKGGLTVQVCGQDLPTQARSVWYRRIRSAPLPDGMDPGIHDYCVREAHTLVHGLALVASDRVMSDPGAVMRAENKLLQLATAQALGLSIPETCASNDPDRVRALASRHTHLICKPLRSGWFRDANAEWSVYTTALDAKALEGIESVRLAPSIFQPLIEKACDVRVTIVDGVLFVAEIDSQSDESSRVDWRRTTNPGLPHRRATLPLRTEHGLLSLMARLNLRFGAIDLIRTPDDEYVFLEVNPNGQWLWLDDQLDLGISKSIAAWLNREPHG